MAFSYVEYTTNSGANGGKDYTYSFGAVDHNTTNIKVTLGGTSLTASQYSVVQGTVTLTTVPGAGSAPFDAALSTSNILRVFRETNRTTAEVVFSANAVIQDEDLNTATDQGRFLALEAVDRANESITIDTTDLTQYDIAVSSVNKRITGVAEPSNDNDVATKLTVANAALGTVSGTTLTSPVINTSVSGTAIDTDLTSTSSSDDTLASAKAIKTYVDAQIQTEDTIAELNDTTITGTPADNEVLAYDTSSSKWINQTATEAGLATETYSDTGDTTTEANALSNSIVFSIALG
jgi:hypothetical protein